MKKFISLMKVMEKSSKTALTGWILKIVIALAACGMAYFCGTKAVGIYHLMFEDSVNAEVMFKVIFALFTVIIICLAFVNIINLLYMSDDLLILMTMPFTELQIVGVAIANEIKTALLLSIFVLFPFNAAFGIGLNKPVSFYLMAGLASIVLPVITICITASVIMIIFRVFKIFSNRNFIRYFGILLGILAYVGYICFTGGKNVQTGTASVLSGLEKIVDFIPGIHAVGGLMHSVSLTAFAELAAVVAASIAILAALSKTIYIDTALRMKESIGKNQQMSVDVLSKKYKRKHIIRSIMEKDIKITLRTPAYLLNGYLITYLFPALICLVCLIEKGSLKDLSMAEMSFKGPEQLAILLFESVIYTIFMAGSNYVGLTPISREGNQLLLMKQMPVSFKTVLKGKICAALLVCGIPTVGYITLAGIILVFMNKLSLIYMLFGILINMLVLISVINMNTFVDMKKPVLNWSSEAAMLKEKGITRQAWILAIIMFVIAASIAILAASSVNTAMIYIFIIQLVITLLSNLLVTKTRILSD